MGVVLLIGYIQFPLADDLFSHRRGISLTITDRYGIVLRETLSAEGGRTTWLSCEDLPEHVIHAALEAEDRRFFSHPGVDVLALLRAMYQNLRAGKVLSGGSTITQQLVKHLFGYPRTIPGKLQEMLMALRLEQTYSKEEILTHYLNRVSFSNQAFGVEAAARRYFQKPAAHLTLAESVFLLGLIQAPSRYNPYRHFQSALQRQRRLLEHMHEREAISDTEYQLALAETIRLTPKRVNFKAPHFCNIVLERLRPTKNGKTPITTTLDSSLQEQVEDIVTSRIDELEAYNVTNAAVLVLDNREGDILAYVGSKDFFDEENSGQVNGVTALRQPGSTLKPFTYQLALEHGYTPATLLPDIQEYPAQARSFLPENYDRTFHGPVRLREALACSYNIPAVRVVDAIGVDALYNRLHAYGFDSLQELPSFYGPGLTLGNGEVTLLELTRAYSILARRGKRLKERYVADEPRAKSRQLFSPQTIYLLTHILTDRQAAIPAFGENTPLDLPFQTAVKTGTSKDYRDNWTVGFTRDFTVGVWVGNFDGSPMRNVSGISGAAPIYRDVMLALYRYRPPSGLLSNPPAGIVTRTICPLSGALVNEDCPHSLEERFVAGTEPTDPCQWHQSHWVDRRNGLLTEPASPYALQKTFVHFPPLYQTWAHDMGYPIPPSTYSRKTSSSKTTQTALIHIVHPSDGDVYAIDPVLRREFQTLQLSAVVAPDITRITWYIDDHTLFEEVEAPFQSGWEIEPGSHTIYASGQYRGKTVRSPEITVHVVE